MNKVGELECELHSYNTCEHQERVFNFGPDSQGKLVVSELFLGEEAGVREVNGGVKCKCSSIRFFACCALGDRILVMAGERDATDFFCALVTIDAGELTKKSIHVEEKKVTGWEKYEPVPFLAQISENKVWASFYYSDEIWIGELKGDDLVMTKHSDHLPTEKGFGVPPVRLPDGRFLAAGGHPLCTAITAITPGERFSFEKIGDMPGEGRYCVSTTLIKERFLVGFGGWNDNDVDAMWIFDLQTHRASGVAKEGNWHPGGWWPFLTVKDNIVCIVGGYNSTNVHFLSLQCLSELIQDLDLQGAFQRELGLELRRYPILRRECGEFRGMRDLGGCFPRYRSDDTVNHQERVFHFCQDRKKLCVTEILFGSTLKTKTVDTGVDCKTDDDNHISCCSFGAKIFVMTGSLRNADDVLCALVTIDPGELSRESIHIEKKRLTGFHSWDFGHYLAQFAENKVWVSFDLSDEIWIGEINGDELAMTNHPGRPFTWKKIGVSPLRLPDGSLLVAGQSRSSTAILLVTLEEQLCFQELGHIPGSGREEASTVLVGGRFVVGFGGVSGITLLEPDYEPDYVDAMWILDLKTHRVSPMKKEGEWHPGGPWPVLVVRDRELYVIGGRKTTAAHSLSFTTLVRLIQNGRVRCAFCSCLGLQFWFDASLHRSTVMYYAPHWL